MLLGGSMLCRGGYLHEPAQQMRCQRNSPSTRHMLLEEGAGPKQLQSHNECPGQPSKWLQQYVVDRVSSRKNEGQIEDKCPVSAQDQLISLSSCTDF